MRPLPRLLACFGLSACAAGTFATQTERVTTASGRLAAVLVDPAYDGANATATCKVYHHVFAPDGRLLTKGEGGDFEHHRGLFVGWNQVRCGEQHFDFWHCHNGERLEFRGFRPATAQTVAIDWIGGDGNVVLHELRRLQACDLGPDCTQLDLDITLQAGAVSVQLDGDPQHAGQQFRALNLFAPIDAPKVRYLRPDTATAHGNDVWAGCAWIAAILPLPDGPVTVLRCEHANNPPAIWSTRDYGRFGAMHRTVVRAERSLQLRYRYIIATGARDLPWCEVQAANLALE